jgi:hypothetical protein
VVFFLLCLAGNMETMGPKAQLSRTVLLTPGKKFGIVGVFGKHSLFLAKMGGFPGQGIDGAGSSEKS